MKSFRQALLGGAFTVTADLCLRHDSDAGDFLHRARSIAGHVHGIHLAESGGGRAPISTVALAGLLLREGIDPLPGLHCRDRNRSRRTR